jgi:hypothetical protein
MTPGKITTEILAEYLHCKYKAYLILTGVACEPSPYEHWLHTDEDQYAAGGRSALVRDYSCLNDIRSLSTDHLLQGPTFVVHADVQKEDFAFSFDALQRVQAALGHRYLTTDSHDGR